MKTQSRAVVAIVGRTNVGKSTLFNRLVGRRLALVGSTPGVTRDRIYGRVQWVGKSFSLVDTGGMDVGGGKGLGASVYQQTKIALEEAHTIVFLVDVREGVTVSDREITDYLRRGGKPVILVVNKVDNQGEEVGVPAFYELGIGDPLAVSASQGRGMGSLLDQLVERLPSGGEEGTEEAIRVAIVGRPNVGKSSLLNAILREKTRIAT